MHEKLSLRWIASSAHPFSPLLLCSGCTSEGGARRRKRSFPNYPTLLYRGCSQAMSGTENQRLWGMVDAGVELIAFASSRLIMPGWVHITVLPERHLPLALSYQPRRTRLSRRNASIDAVNCFAPTLRSLRRCKISARRLVDCFSTVAREQQFYALRLIPRMLKKKNS